MTGSKPELADWKKLLCARGTRGLTAGRALLHAGALRLSVLGTSAVLTRIMVALYLVIGLLALLSAHVGAFGGFGPARLTMQKSTSTRLNLFGAPEPKKDSPAKSGGGGLFGGMGGGGGMMDKMKQAQDMMKQAETINKELMETVVMGQDAQGQVFATFNGMAVPVGLKISDAMLAQGGEAVSLAATQAMIDAHQKAQGVMMQRMSQLYGGLPGMGGMMN